MSPAQFRIGNFFEGRLPGLGGLGVVANPRCWGVGCRNSLARLSFLRSVPPAPIVYQAVSGGVGWGDAIDAFSRMKAILLRALYFPRAKGGAPSDIALGNYTSVCARDVGHFGRMRIPGAFRGGARLLTVLRTLVPSSGALTASGAASGHVEDVGLIALSLGVAIIRVVSGAPRSRRLSGHPRPLARTYNRISPHRRPISLARGDGSGASMRLRCTFAIQSARRRSASARYRIPISGALSHSALAVMCQKAFTRGPGCVGSIPAISGAAVTRLTYPYSTGFNRGASLEIALGISPRICARGPPCWVGANRWRLSRRSVAADWSLHSGASIWCVNRIGSGIGTCGARRPHRLAAGGCDNPGRLWGAWMFPGIGAPVSARDDL